MAERMPAATWTFLRKEFPGEFIKFTTTLQNFRAFRYRRNGKAKSIRQMYGDFFNELMNWLEENTSEPWYARRVDSDLTNTEMIIEFYFTNEADAMAFKLMYGFDNEQ